MDKQKPTAFISGATSGIGRSFAFFYAAKGYDLILTGRRKPVIEESCTKLIEAYGCKIRLMIGDLQSQSFQKEVVRVLDTCPFLDVVINNAGFGTCHPFHENNTEEIQGMINAHITSTVLFSRAALPGMISRKRGFIINVSSLGAFTPGVSQTLYMATKCFIHNFSKSLKTEVESFGVKVQSLCPGLTRTDFHRYGNDIAAKNVATRLIYMRPEKVVEDSIHDLERGRFFCIPGMANKLFYLSAKIFPPSLLRQITTGF